MPRTQLNLVAFLSGSAVNGDSWRHPDSDIGADLDFGRYKAYAQALERGKFDALFFYDNVLGVPDPALLTANPGLPRWEPLTLLAALAVVTDRIGLIGTASTTFNEPYNLARRLASLDHLSGGRAGWNLVTATGGAENFNLDTHVDHAERYQRAHEFHDVVTGLWDSYAEGAVVKDKASGRWADPSKVHVLNHKGRFYQVQGPLNTPRPVQGHPVIAQAGASDDGKELAGRVGEVLYTAEHDIGLARAFYADVKARAARHGRDPGHVRILPGVSPFVGRTQGEAEDKYEDLLRYRDQVATLRGLSNYASLGVDLSTLPFDEPIRLPDEIAETNSHKSRQRLMVDWIRQDRPTVRQLYRKFTAGGHRVLVGTPQSIADDFEEWFTTGAADGFTIMFPSAPAGIEDFVTLVVPELQRRGLFRQDYPGRTLRDTLGLPVPRNRFFA
ncbi:LLM class flavin-dependent oxidoreductase [Nitrospirillum sp. BR 11163]|uniref:LLM class flavin-dependent oxidoreductase n=1 Tax=Nitrospirillum sp. BR 11163 TaxID=3104323 RepID=UPI002AFE6914|nr:LLM class flavin-dependent oxidoreductase [Nitrospirillum sp. BR 11163]MEA1674644.1 LLM class flavin-dependent oxidoreductase [Nitrospirillum sp. BR 11163]